MKHFIKKTIFVSFPILTLLVCVNYFGDAAKIFDSEYEKEMAEIISKGNFVTNISNYDERLFQKECIERIDILPEIIVIGSSRTMLINETYFPNHSLYNNSVSGASLEDLIALYQIYKDQKLSPKKIIIGIDPWIFNENNGRSRWKSIQYFYNKFHKKNISELPSNCIHKYDELFSFSYFQSSIKVLPKVILGTSKPIATLKKYNTTATKLTDGSLVYGNTFRNATQAEINSKINKYILGDIYSIENFDNISKKKWIEFQGFINHLQKEKIIIELFLCPYAPIVFDKVSKSYTKVEETQNRIVEYARNNGLKIYGSFSPYDLGIDETYFYDGMHCKEIGIEKILNNDNH